MSSFSGKKFYFFSFVLRIVTAVIFLSTVAIPSSLYAQSPAVFPPIGSMVALSPAFTPTILRGLEIDPANPFKFQFIVDRGDNPLTEAELKTESEKVIRYFLAGLAVPEGKLWVNLSPYEGDRVVDEVFGQTEMGRDLLAQDYILKQITASLFSPDGQFGKDFWSKVYKSAFEKFHTTNIPINTFNKVWVIPDKATVYANGNRAMIVESELNVLLEQDYLSIEKNLLNDKFGTQKQEANSTKEISAMSSQIVREAVLPQLRSEVNTGKNFAQLRQVYHSLILANWFKENLKQAVLNKVYSDKNKVGAISVEDKEAAKKIYDRYLVAFKKGVYDFMKVEYDPYMKKSVPRKYFSGGFDLNVHPKTIQNSADIGSSARGLYESMKGRLFGLYTFLGGKASEAVVKAKKTTVAISLAGLIGLMSIFPLAHGNTNSNMKTVVNYIEAPSGISVAPVGLLDYVPTSVVDEANKTVFGEFVLGDVTRSTNTSSLEQNVITFYTTMGMKVGTLTTMYYKADKEVKYKLNLSPEFSKRSFSDRTFNSEAEILAAMDAALLTSGSQADFISQIEIDMGKSEAFGPKDLNLSLDPKDIKALEDSLSNYNFNLFYRIKVIDNRVKAPIGEIQVSPKPFGTGNPIINYRVVQVKDGKVQVVLPGSNGVMNPVPNIKDFFDGKSMPTTGWTDFIPGDKSSKDAFSTAAGVLLGDKKIEGDNILNPDVKEETNTPLRNRLINAMKKYYQRSVENRYEALLNPDSVQTTLKMDSAGNVLVTVANVAPENRPDTIIVQNKNVVKEVVRENIVTPEAAILIDLSGTQKDIAKFNKTIEGVITLAESLYEINPEMIIHYAEVDSRDVVVKTLPIKDFLKAARDKTLFSRQEGKGATFFNETSIALAKKLAPGCPMFGMSDITQDKSPSGPFEIVTGEPLSTPFNELTKIMESKEQSYFLLNTQKPGVPGQAPDLINLMSSYNTDTTKLMKFYITNEVDNINNTLGSVAENYLQKSSENINITAPLTQMSNVNSFEIGLFKDGTLISAVNPSGASVTGDNFLEENLPDDVVTTDIAYVDPLTGVTQGFVFPPGAQKADFTFYKVSNEAPLKGGQDTLEHKTLGVIDGTSSLAGEGPAIKSFFADLIDSNMVGMTVFKGEGEFKTAMSNNPNDFEGILRDLRFQSSNTDFVTPFGDALDKAKKYQEDAIDAKILEYKTERRETITREDAAKLIPVLDVIAMTDLVNVAKNVDFLKENIEKLIDLKIQIIVITKRTNYAKAFTDMSEVSLRSEKDILSDKTIQTFFELTALTNRSPEKGSNFFEEGSLIAKSLRGYIVSRGLSGKVKIPENGMQKVIKVVFTNEDGTQTTKYYQVEDLPAGTNQDGSELVPQGGTDNRLMKGYGPADRFGWVEQVAQDIKANVAALPTQGTVASSNVEYGGIDFNADKFKTQTKGSGIDMNVPFDESMLKDFNPDAVSPVIIQIVPILNPQSLLGLADEKSQDFKGQISQKNESSEKKSGSRYPTGNYALQAAETAFLAIS